MERRDPDCFASEIRHFIDAPVTLHDDAVISGSYAANEFGRGRGDVGTVESWDPV